MQTTSMSSMFKTEASESATTRRNTQTYVNLEQVTFIA